mgnify:CR=1 FL=1
MTESADIALSPSAAARVAAIAERQGKPPILRLSVDGGGCAGFQYRFGLADGADADDVAASCDGVTLVVEPSPMVVTRGPLYHRTCHVRELPRTCMKRWSATR